MTSLAPDSRPRYSISVAAELTGLHQQTLRGSGRALGHAIILATTTDKTGPSTATPAKIL